MNRIIIVAVFAIFFHSLQAQNRPSSVAFDLGYFGETFTKAGVSAAVQQRITGKNDLHHVRLNIAFYKHSGYNNNLLVLPEYVFRKTGKRGWLFELSAGSGWMYQQPDQPVIQYENGIFSETNGGWHYVAPTIQFGGGKKMRQGALEGVAFTAGLRWFGQYPFNDFLMHHLALECRGSFPLEIFR